MFEIFAHTADAGLHVESPDLNGVFVEAATALTSLIVANSESVRCVTRREFRIAGSEHEFLLVDWLNELLYAFESEHLLFREFTAAVDEQGLTASASGEPWDGVRHQLAHEVKAITYHELLVARVGDHWEANVIVDI